MNLEKLIPFVLPFAIGCAGVQTTPVKETTPIEKIAKEKSKVKEPVEDQLTEVSTLISDLMGKNESSPVIEIGSLSDLILEKRLVYKIVRHEEPYEGGFTYKVQSEQLKGITFNFVDIHNPEKNLPLGKQLDMVVCTPEEHHYCQTFYFLYFVDVETSAFKKELLEDIHEGLARNAEYKLKGFPFHAGYEKIIKGGFKALIYLMKPEEQESF